MIPRPLVLALACALCMPSMAADKDKPEPPKWDVNAAHGAVKSVKFTTDEGTWMDLDVSPDGRTIVFALLGDLYTLPIAGGDAKRVTSGPQWDVQPRFSPDGSEIAFTSDRGGGNNLWRVRVDGSHYAQVTKEDFRLLNNPVWTPDGQYLIGRKHFTSERSLGAGELWLFHKSGGAGLQLTKKKNDQQDLGEPALSPDGRYVYFSEDVSGGSTFQYNKNLHGVIYAIRRLDRQTGEIDNMVATAGGSVRPQPSPDGKILAFVKRVREKTVLHLYDIESGLVTPLWNGLSHDQQEGWAVFGPYANFGWTPDSGAIVIWAQGKLWRVDAASGAPSAIPFTAEVEQTVAAPLRFEQQLESGGFTAKMIRDVATSPDGKTLVFHAVGKLWRKALPNGKAQRLSTRADAFEYQPSFSADGRKLLYITWNDAAQGAIIERDLASGNERTLSTQPGFYYGPQYSLDGSRIVCAKQCGGGLTGSLWTRRAGHLVDPGGRRRGDAAGEGRPESAVFLRRRARVLPDRRRFGQEADVGRAAWRGPRGVQAEVHRFRRAEPGSALCRLHRVVQCLRRAAAGNRRQHRTQQGPDRHPGQPGQRPGRLLPALVGSRRRPGAALDGGRALHQSLTQ
ncbi:MAG: PD40 domain-containing protein [Xanthomonadales bacterium]|nr:PD40 domain-containing protein [Xanthomonadales bacterium]